MKAPAVYHSTILSMLLWKTQLNRNNPLRSRLLLVRLDIFLVQGALCSPPFFLRNESIIGHLKLNSHTRPGFIFAILLVIFFVFMITCLKAPWLNAESISTRATYASISTVNTIEEKKSLGTNEKPIGSCLVGYLTFLSVGMLLFSIDLATFEVVLVPFTQAYFSWHVWENALSITASGLIGFFSLQVVRIWTLNVKEYLIFLFGQMLMIGSIALFINWSFDNSSSIALWRCVIGIFLFSISHSFCWFPLLPMQSKLLPSPLQVQ